MKTRFFPVTSGRASTPTRLCAVNPLRGTTTAWFGSTGDAISPIFDRTELISDKAS
jgi:hypothetical protein